MRAATGAGASDESNTHPPIRKRHQPHLAPGGVAGPRARRGDARAARRGRELFPAPVGLDAVPQRHRQGRRHLDRGHRRPPLHGFPRQQRAPHRLRPSAPEARDRRADGRAAVRAAPLYLRAGGRARGQARRDRAGQSVQGAVHDRRLGRRRGGDQDRARRDRPLQDAVVLGRVPRRGLRRRRAVGRGAVPLRRRRPADAGRASTSRLMPAIAAPTARRASRHPARPARA